MSTRRDDFNTDYTQAGSTGPAYDAGEPAFGAQDRSTHSLVRELLREVSTLARKEMALATSEMRENLAHARRDATAITTGGVVLMGGYFVLLIAATALLAEVMEPWVAALIVGGIAAIAGYMMMKGGMEKLRQRDLKPQRTIESLHRNANAVREARHGYH